MPCYDKINWELEEVLKQEFSTGAILMDLPKTFYSIPHDFLIAKLHAYQISLNAAATLINPYLKH